MEFVVDVEYLDFEVKTIDKIEKIHQNAAGSVNVGEMVYHQRIALVPKANLQCRDGIPR